MPCNNLGWWYMLLRWHNIRWYIHIVPWFAELDTHQLQLMMMIDMLCHILWWWDCHLVSQPVYRHAWHRSWGWHSKSVQKVSNHNIFPPLQLRGRSGPHESVGITWLTLFISLAGWFGYCRAASVHGSLAGQPILNTFSTWSLPIASSAWGTTRND